MLYEPGIYLSRRLVVVVVVVVVGVVVIVLVVVFFTISRFFYPTTSAHPASVLTDTMYKVLWSHSVIIYPYYTAT